MIVRPYEVELAVVRGREFLVRAVFRPPCNVTMGTNPRCAVSLPDAVMPEFLDLLRLEKAGTALRFDRDMVVEIDTGQGIRRTKELIDLRVAREDRDGFTVGLPLGTKGLVQWGDIRVMVKIASPRPAPVRMARPGTPACCGECASMLQNPVMSIGALNPCARCGTLNRVEAPELAREFGNTLHAFKVPQPEPEVLTPGSHRVGPTDTSVQTNQVPALLLAAEEGVQASMGPRTPVELEGLRTMPQMSTLSSSGTPSVPTSPRPAPPAPPPSASDRPRSRSLLYEDEDERPTPPNVPIQGRGQGVLIGPSETRVNPATAAARGEDQPGPQGDLPVFEAMANIKGSSPPPPTGRRPADLPTFDAVSQLRPTPPPPAANTPRVPSRPDQVIPAAPGLVVRAELESRRPPEPPRPSAGPDRSPAASAPTTPLAWKVQGPEPTPPPPPAFRPPPGPAGRPGMDLPSYDAIGALRQQGLTTQGAISALRGGEEGEPPILRSSEVRRFEPLRGATAALDSLPEAAAAAAGQPAAVQIGGVRAVVSSIAPAAPIPSQVATRPKSSPAAPPPFSPPAEASPGPTVAVRAIGQQTSSTRMDSEDGVSPRPSREGPGPTLMVPVRGAQPASTRGDDDPEPVPFLTTGRLYVAVGVVCGGLGLALLLYAIFR